MTADGRLAVSASADDTLNMWDLASGQLVRTLQGHIGWVNGVAVTADGRLAVSAAGDNTLMVWDLASGQPVRTLRGHTHSVNGVAVTADGRLVVSASGDNTLKIWNLGTGQAIANLETYASLSCCAITQNGQTLLAGDIAGGVHILEWRNAPRRSS